MDESLQLGVRARERLLHLEPLAREQLWQQPRLERAVRAPGDPGERAEILKKALCGGRRR